MINVAMLILVPSCTPLKATETTAVTASQNFNAPEAIEWYISITKVDNLDLSNRDVTVSRRASIRVNMIYHEADAIATLPTPQSLVEPAVSVITFVSRKRLLSERLLSQMTSSFG